ncbi:hypothetical protein [Herbaspirillum aquaticum]|uniref:Uncharacterized protein n=1 Tax=Herbaspirillum aquaticum TaxID=568783 RepID=A0A225SS71_9BURK|nr:hypothetical protein [Herbaspirillum aquaticum]OWY33949.1 hypothetical protein CEJ45_15085 [Herbaspirillum aquaticum]
MTSFEREQRIREEERIRLDEQMKVAKRQQEKENKAIRDAQKKAVIGAYITEYGFKAAWIKVVTPYILLSILAGIFCGFLRWLNMEKESIWLKIFEPILWGIGAAVIGALVSMVAAWLECIEARE